MFLIYFKGKTHEKTWLIGKDFDAGRDWGQEEKGTTEDEVAGWHHWLDGRESEWTPGVGDGQRGLVCCDSWGRKESNTTERLNWTELNWKEKLGVSIPEDLMKCFIVSSVSQFSRSVVFDSLRPHEPQHARPPCPAPTPGVHPNACPLSRLNHKYAGLEKQDTAGFWLSG